MEIQEYVNLFLLSLMTASLSLFFQECMEPGMIFRRYYLWLTYHWIKNWRKKDRWKRWLLKPSGMCVYCNGAWISIMFFMYFFGPDIKILLFLGLNYMWTKILKIKFSIWQSTSYKCFKKNICIYLKPLPIFDVENDIKQKISLFN